MVYDWVQGRTFHYLALKNLDLEQNFHTEMFPTFSIQPENDKALAHYFFAEHRVVFYDNWFYQMKGFTHVYFHELIHSTNWFSQRFTKHFGDYNPVDIAHYTGMEERIADIGGLVLYLAYRPGKVEFTKIFRTIATSIEQNETRFKLPWGEVEQAVWCYAKNKDCSKLKDALQLVKRIIKDNNLTKIHEGCFND